MNQPNGFQRMAGVTAVLGGILTIASIIFSLLSINFNVALFGDPLTMLNSGSAGAQQFGWSMVADVYGYYLLLVPTILFLRYWLQKRSRWLADLSTAFGLMYVTMGALGAAFLWQAWPAIINSYGTAAPPEQQTLLTIFQIVTGGIQSGIWNISGSLGGLWWLGIGYLLRTSHRALSSFTLLLGAATVLTTLVNVFGLTAVGEFTILLYLFLAPVWALWLGTTLLVKANQPLTVPAGA